MDQAPVTPPTPPALSASLGERARQAAEIAGKPQHYKICEGCESIVSRRVPICPNCSGYRFNTAKQAIVNQAKLLGSREQTGVTAADLL